MDDDLLVVLPDPDKPSWRPSTLNYKTDRGGFGYTPVCDIVRTGMGEFCVTSVYASGVLMRRHGMHNRTVQDFQCNLLLQ